MTTPDRRLLVSLVALVVTAFGVKIAEAQFSPPTCVPPSCNPTVIQNIPLTGTAQTADFNITGDAGVGDRMEAGRQLPTFTGPTDYLFFGNVNAASTAGYLLALQLGGADRMKVSIAGQSQLPIGSAAAPSYSFLTDTNTGFYSNSADRVDIATNGVSRTFINNSGTTINSGVLSVPTGSAAAPSITFTGDTNTGIYRSAADTINLTTNGVSRLQADSTGVVTVPGSLSVTGTFTSVGGLSGDGSAITNLNATNIASGTLNDGRLTTNVALYNANGTYTGANTFSNASNAFTGSGSNLTNLNASNVSSGTLNDGRLTTNVALYNANGTYTGANNYTGANTFSNAGNSFTGTHSGDGSALTNLNASNLASGTVPDGRLSGTYTQALTFNNAANSFTGVGTGLTALNGSNISSGTVATARLPATVVYTNTAQTISGVKTFSGNNTYSGMSSFGSGTIVIDGTLNQNLIYGNVDTTSTGNLLLLQNEGVDRVKVEADGDTTISGNLVVTGTVSGTLNELDTLQSVTTRGSTTTTSMQASSMGVGTTPVAGRGVNVQATDYGVMATALGGVTTVGVYGYGDTYGVQGGGTAGAGGYFTSNTNYGAYGGSNSNIGVYGYGAPGVRGEGFGATSMGGVFKSGGTGDALRVIAPTAGNSFIIRNNADASTVFAINQAGSVTTGGVPWARLTGYPSACAAGTYVSGVGGTLTCGGSFWTTIDPPAGTNPVPDGGAADTLVLADGAGISISGDATTDTITITNTGDTDASDDVVIGGTQDYLSKFDGGGNLNDSIIYEDTSQGYIGIGTTAPNRTFEVRNGDIGTYSGSIFASFGSVSAYIVAAGGVGVTGQAVGVGTMGVVGVGEEYGVYGSGDEGGHFVGDDNFAGAGVYAEWTGTGAGGAVKGYTTRPAAWAGWFEATDGTNVNTKGIYTSAPDSAGGKALWVAGDAHVTSDISVTGNETVGGVSTEAYNVITNYAQFTEAGADPASSEGRFAYINNKFRCNENGTWKDCVTPVGVTSTGTTNYVPKFSPSSTALANSAIYDSGGSIGIGTTSPGGKLQVDGTGSYGIYVGGTPSWGVYSTAPIEAQGTTNAIRGTAVGGAGAVAGTATGAADFVYGVMGNTTATTGLNSGGVYGTGKNGVLGNSTMAGGAGLRAQAFTNASAGVNSILAGTGDLATYGGNTFGVLSSNLSTGGQSNFGINAQATGAGGTNIGAYLNASGATNNYSLVTVGGYVGFFDQSPTSPVVVGLDGSAAAPSFSIGAGDDSNTGFWHPGSDTLAISTAGTERLRINSSGYVGIGVNPSYQLDVTGTTYAGRFTSSSYGSEFWPAYSNYGLHSQSTSSGNSQNRGGNFYGWYGTSSNMGLYAYGYGGGNAYGVYADAGGASNNYSFYGASGRIYNAADMQIAGGAGFGGETPSSSYGVRAQGTTMGGYFQDNTAGETNTYAYLGYFTYGGYFNSTNNQASYNNIGVYGYGYYGYDAIGLYGYAGGGANKSYGLYVGSGTARVSCAATWVDRGSYIDCADIAEVYEAGEELEPGDVVVWKEDGGKKLYKSRKPYEESIAGVYSTSPGVLMGNQDTEGTYGVEIGNYNTKKTIEEMDGSGQMPLALAGRAPVKVTAENGAISPGDLLTSSSKPGYAMKATDTGRVIGIAMESFDGAGDGDRILAFINAHYWVNPSDYEDLKSDLDGLKADIEKLKARE